MFTGIIEEIGHIVSVSMHGKIMNLSVEGNVVFDDMKIGDSISIEGVCQTVTEFNGKVFKVQAVEETIKRTIFRNFKKGVPVNLERALRLSDRLGGHMVQGHVDGTGRVTSIKETADNVLLSIAPEPGLDRYIVEKGSITINGISLTVTHAKNGEFGTSIIPHTFKATTLTSVRKGDIVNLETDIIAKYIDKLIKGESSLTLNKLKKLGY
ncbi:riboflavin synthase [Candidatus Latescibacterota bacterium]